MKNKRKGKVWLKKTVIVLVCLCFLAQAPFYAFASGGLGGAAGRGRIPHRSIWEEHFEDDYKDWDTSGLGTSILVSLATAGVGAGAGQAETAVGRLVSEGLRTVVEITTRAVITGVGQGAINSLVYGEDFWKAAGRSAIFSVAGDIAAWAGGDLISRWGLGGEGFWNGASRAGLYAVAHGFSDMGVTAVLANNSWLGYDKAEDYNWGTIAVAGATGALRGVMYGLSAGSSETETVEAAAEIGPRLEDGRFYSSGEVFIGPRLEDGRFHSPETYTLTTAGGTELQFSWKEDIIQPAAIGFASAHVGQAAAGLAYQLSGYDSDIRAIYRQAREEDWDDEKLKKALEPYQRRAGRWMSIGGIIGATTIQQAYAVAFERVAHQKREKEMAKKLEGGQEYEIEGETWVYDEEHEHFRPKISREEAEESLPSWADDSAWLEVAGRSIWGDQHSFEARLSGFISQDSGEDQQTSAKAGELPALADFRARLKGEVNMNRSAQLQLRERVIDLVRTRGKTLSPGQMEERGYLRLTSEGKVLPAERLVPSSVWDAAKIVGKGIAMGALAGTGGELIAQTGRALGLEDEVLIHELRQSGTAFSLQLSPVVLELAGGLLSKEKEVELGAKEVEVSIPEPQGETFDGRVVFGVDHEGEEILVFLDEDMHTYEAISFEKYREKAGKERKEVREAANEFLSEAYVSKFRAEGFTVGDNLEWKISLQPIYGGTSPEPPISLTDLEKLGLTVRRPADASPFGLDLGRGEIAFAGRGGGLTRFRQALFNPQMLGLVAGGTGGFLATAALRKENEDYDPADLGSEKYRWRKGYDSMLGRSFISASRQFLQFSAQELAVWGATKRDEDNLVYRDGLIYLSPRQRGVELELSGLIEERIMKERLGARFSDGDIDGRINELVDEKTENLFVRLFDSHGGDEQEIRKAIRGVLEGEGNIEKLAEMLPDEVLAKVVVDIEDYLARYPELAPSSSGILSELASSEYSDRRKEFVEGKRKAKLEGDIEGDIEGARKVFESFFRERKEYVRNQLGNQMLSFSSSLARIVESGTETVENRVVEMAKRLNVSDEDVGQLLEDLGLGEKFGASNVTPESMHNHIVGQFAKLSGREEKDVRSLAVTSGLGEHSIADVFETSRRRAGNLLTDFSTRGAEEIREAVLRGIPENVDQDSAKRMLSSLRLENRLQKGESPETIAKAIEKGVAELVLPKRKEEFVREKLEEDLLYFSGAVDPVYIVERFRDKIREEMPDSPWEVDAGELAKQLEEIRRGALDSPALAARGFGLNVERIVSGLDDSLVGPRLEDGRFYSPKSQQEAFSQLVEGVRATTEDVRPSLGRITGQRWNWRLRQFALGLGFDMLGEVVTGGKSWRSSDVYGMSMLVAGLSSSVMRDLSSQAIPSVENNLAELQRNHQKRLAGRYGLDETSFFTAGSGRQMLPRSQVSPFAAFFEGIGDAHLRAFKEMASFGHPGLGADVSNFARYAVNIRGMDGLLREGGYTPAALESSFKRIARDYTSGMLTASPEIARWGRYHLSYIDAAELVTLRGKSVLFDQDLTTLKDIARKEQGLQPLEDPETDDIGERTLGDLQYQRGSIAHLIAENYLTENEEIDYQALNRDMKDDDELAGRMMQAGFARIDLTEEERSRLENHFGSFDNVGELARKIAKVHPNLREGLTLDFGEGLKFEYRPLGMAYVFDNPFFPGGVTKKYGIQTGSGLYYGARALGMDTPRYDPYTMQSVASTRPRLTGDWDILSKISKPTKSLDVESKPEKEDDSEISREITRTFHRIREREEEKVKMVEPPLPDLGQPGPKYLRERLEAQWDPYLKDSIPMPGSLEEMGVTSPLAH